VIGLPPTKRRASGSNPGIDVVGDRLDPRRGRLFSATAAGERRLVDALGSAS
jgi:hypothetical protein